MFNQSYISQNIFLHFQIAFCENKLGYEFYELMFANI